MKVSCGSLAAAALLLSAPLALAQTGTIENTSGSGSATQTDRTYLQKDARGAMYELQISQLAAQKAQNPQVKQYAQMIVSQHQQANQQLRQVAQQNGVTLPTQPNSAERRQIARLRTLNGSSFDQAYVQDVKRANQDDIADEQKEIGSTQNSAIKQFVQAEQQLDQHHAQGAQALQANGSSNG